VDVASIVGDRIAVSDESAYLQLAIQMATDPEAHRAASALTAEVLAERPTVEDAVDQVEKLIAAAIDLRSVAKSRRSA
jgi:hypothetical protein